MDIQGFPVDHIGIVVPSIDASIDVYHSLLGISLSHREKLIEQWLEVAFFDLPNISLELVAPLTDQGPVAKFLSTRGPGLHHICYRVPNVQSALDHCRSIGLTLIDEKPRLGARGKLIAFLHPKSCNGILTEFCQKSSNG